MTTCRDCNTVGCLGLAEHQMPMQFGTPAGKLVRRDAPVTSRAAGLAVDTGPGERMAFRFISASRTGMTAKEYAALVGKPLNTVSGRFSGLAQKGYIEPSGARRAGSRVMRACQPSGKALEGASRPSQRAVDTKYACEECGTTWVGPSWEVHIITCSKLLTKSKESHD